MRAVTALVLRSALAIACFHAAQACAVAGDFPLWGNLPKGAHAVGFRSLWQFDYARTYNMTFEDKSSYATGKAPRPILINIWYPADPKAQGKEMLHREYLEIASDDPQLRKFSAELANYERGVIAKEVMHKAAGKLLDPEKQLLEQLLNSATACRRSAPPAAGKFPLVIYHAGAGSSFEDNSVLCEFLASHGFVVLGSAFQQPTGQSFNVDGHAASGRDMDFLIAYARQLPNADWNHIGVIGHSRGAHAAVSFRAQDNSVLDAVVSLDTTQDYYSLADPRWYDMTTAVQSHRHNFTGPLLVVANPHAFFQMCDALASCRRYYLTLKDLSHNDFIAQGCISNEIRLKLNSGPKEASRGTEPAEAEVKTRAIAVRQGYEALCAYVLRFLEAYLKADKQAHKYLERQYRDTKLGGIAPHVEYVPEGSTGPQAYRESDSALPTPRQLRPFLREHGVDKTISLLRKVRKEDPASPVLHPIFAFALVYELLDQGKHQEGIALCNYFRESQPTFAKLFVQFGEAFGRGGKSDFGLSCFKKALILEPGNAEVAKKLRGLEKSGAK